MKKVLSIAGSDSGGGAGIQADIKTVTVHKMYAMSVITALTAQNTMGVSEIFPVTAAFVGAQLDSVFTDIFPDSVKIGMVSHAEIIEVIAEKLKFYHAENIVLDPVMVATSGSRLMRENSVEVLKQKLFPLADIVTPNIPEAEVLSGISIKNGEDMQRAAEKISTFTKGAVLVKGGHLSDSAEDLLYFNGKSILFRSARINNPNTHGTGCTLSSAIACGIAKGLPIHEAVQEAKTYLTGAIAAQLNLGHGSGPLDHTYAI